MQIRSEMTIAPKSKIESRAHYAPHGFTIYA